MAIKINKNTLKKDEPVEEEKKEQTETPPEEDYEKDDLDPLFDLE